MRKDSVILTLQIRAVAKSRLLERMGALGPDTLEQLDRALKITLHLP